MHLTISGYSQTNDCGCNAALRYDAFKSERNFYSEMLLAREINSENYKEIEQRASGGLSLFGIKVGASGENIEKIKSINQEKLLNINISNELTKYESITTSNISYETFGACMEKCLDAQKDGFKAYIIKESDKEVTIALSYRNINGSPSLTVKYGTDIDHPSKIVVKVNTYPTVTIKRKNTSAFTVVFESTLYKPFPVNVNEYKPIKAIMNVTYNEIIEKDAAPRVYAVMTDNNSNQSAGLNDFITFAKNLQDISTLPQKGDGSYKWAGCSNGNQFKATIAGFKFSSSSGEKLRNFKYNCDGKGGNGCSYFEVFGTPSSTENLVFALFRTYGLPVLITCTVETYKEVKVDKEITSFTTGNTISFIIPKKCTDAIIHYGALAVKAGESNPKLTLIGNSQTTENYFIYDYQVEDTKTQTFFTE